MGVVMTETQIKKHMADKEYQKNYMIVFDTKSSPRTVSSGMVRPKSQNQSKKKQ